MAAPEGLEGLDSLEGLEGLDTLDWKDWKDASRVRRERRIGKSRKKEPERLRWTGMTGITSRRNEGLEGHWSDRLRLEGRTVRTAFTGRTGKKESEGLVRLEGGVCSTLKEPEGLEGLEGLGSLE